ncbi:hypothetical protein PPERSA_10609 [Pseudocohnilembus persalinus]|uniref:Uncharacterized protein n=1 Tax=Pseudocohnilembus persalinus TaxID=266149 RepID=A0A0V0R0B7_PSEPJ|nr:hypothetical protein PPERSA_10609 [Pseudocohnilembus persalinus]|eukprot:KRX07974.1 hypothetical protein PPERSA_10609 [Pseudocohnilembus persalinus]
MKKINKNYVKNIVNGLLTYIQDQKEEIQKYYDKYLSEEDKECLKIRNFFYKYKSKRFRITNKQDFRKLFVTPQQQTLQQKQNVLNQKNRNQVSSQNVNKNSQNQKKKQQKQCGYVDIKTIQEGCSQNQSSQETCNFMQYIDSNNEINDSFTSTVQINQIKGNSVYNIKTKKNEKQKEQQFVNQSDQIQQYNHYMNNFLKSRECGISVIQVPVGVVLKNLVQSQQKSYLNMEDNQQIQQQKFQEKIKLQNNENKCDSFYEFDSENINKYHVNQQEQQKTTERNYYNNYTQKTALSIQGFKYYIRNKKKQSSYKVISQQQNQSIQQDQQDQQQQQQMFKNKENLKQDKIRGKNRGAELERKILRVFFHRFINSELLTYCVHKSRIRNPQYIIRVKNKVLDCLKMDFVQRKDYYNDMNNLMDYEP